MQKKSVFLALSLAFSATVWANDVTINGTGVSLEANKTPINTAKNPQAIAQLPANLHLAVPGKFTVAIAGLSQPPLTVFADDNKTLIGSEADIARLVADSLGLELNVVPTSWEDWPLGVTSGKYDAAISNITVTKARKEKFDFATYRKDSLGFYVKTGSKLKKIEQAEDIAGLRIIVGSGTNQEAILLAWNDENVKKGLQPFTPVYTKDDAAQTLALQSGRADAYFGPNWTKSSLRQQGLAARVVQELEHRALLAGYSRIYLTTGFRQPEAVRLYLSQGYDPQFDTTRNPEEYSQPPFDGRLRFTKLLTIAGQARIA